MHSNCNQEEKFFMTTVSVIIAQSEEVGHADSDLSEQIPVYM